MSHASGEVIYDGTVVGLVEYNGTSDVMKKDIHATPEALHAGWRKACTHKCTCGRPPVVVTLYSSYGDGFYWRALAVKELAR